MNYEPEKVDQKIRQSHMARTIREVLGNPTHVKSAPPPRKCDPFAKGTTTAREGELTSSGGCNSVDGSFDAGGNLARRIGISAGCELIFKGALDWQVRLIGIS